MNLPVASGLPFFGSTFELMRKGPLPFFAEGWRAHGDAFAIRTPGRTMVVMTHPDMVRHVLRTNRQNYIKGAAYDEFRKLGGTGLVSSEGERWKRDRRLAQPAFHRKQLEALAGLMTDCTRDALDALPVDTPFDLGFEMMRLALVIMGHALFDQDLSDEASGTGPAMTSALALLVERSNEPFTLPLYVPTPGNQELKAALSTLDESVRRVVERYRDQGADPSERGGLLLRMLIEARDEEGAGEGFTDAELRDQLLTLFVAGHETTALTLTWCFHLLDANPEARERLEAEVDEVLGDRAPGFADLKRLPWTKQVLEETMRVRPALWAVARNTVEEDEVCGHRIPAGSWVILPIYLTHRHPEFWDEPERFDPERFSPEASAGRHTCAWLPFSAGPRRCIGDSFGMMEMTFALAMFTQRLRLLREDPEPLGWNAQLSLRPERPVRARAARRG